jgi:hypothetical protein
VGSLFLTKKLRQVFVPKDIHLSVVLDVSPRRSHLPRRSIQIPHLHFERFSVVSTENQVSSPRADCYCYCSSPISIVLNH